MARHSTIRDETILDAAREVFLSRGVQATTAEVAERAGVSEGTLFNRFKSKDELFRAAMLSHGVKVAWVSALEERAGKGRVKDNMFEVGLQIVEFFRVLMPFMMMSWSNKSSGDLPAVMQAKDPPPAAAMRSVTAYFAAEIEAGRLRRSNPEILARAFVGGLQSYVFFEMLLKGRDPAPLTAEEFVRGHVSLLWSGVAPPD
ncbi:MAG: TetR/AcrR family transcriptional regulator [Polyangiaceae bacterium]